MRVHLNKVALASLALAICLAFAGVASAKGKKYALFVGINDYPDPINKLQGAVPDAEHMKSLLESKYGFLALNDKILRDGEATRANILAALKALTAKAGAGDLLVFQYSGHGTVSPDAYSWVKDETKKIEIDYPDGSKDPLDYYDSAIVPVDTMTQNSANPWGNNLILDDELYDIFTPATAKGVKVVFIADSCNSGSIGRAGVPQAAVRFTSPRTIFGVKSLADLHTKLKPPAKQTTVTKRTMPGTYIVLSAAQDNEFAMDAAGGGEAGGLFTSTLIDSIKTSKTPLTYKKLMNLVQKRVADTSLTKYSNEQHP
ncbi:MAG: caspase family protein, partial [Acidobacteria bacterium]|nr:caspase family protein [Acidobacteriota bacterium]